jgi:hypothetical protein
MTSAERDRLKKAVQDFTRDAVRTKSTARKALTKSGIYTSKGKVAPEYSAPKKPKVDCPA